MLRWRKLQTGDGSEKEDSKVEEEIPQAMEVETPEFDSLQESEDQEMVGNLKYSYYINTIQKN